jgi:predicted transcriptional regulator
MLRRDRLAIIDHFLEAVSNGSQKSSLMYKINLVLIDLKNIQA